MRKWLAAALALALIAPGPAFAADLRSAEPVPSVSLPGAALSLTRQLPALPSGASALSAGALTPQAVSLPNAALASAVALPAAAVAPQAAAVPAQAARISAPERKSPISAAALAENSATGGNVRPTAMAAASHLAAAAPEQSAPALDQAYDASAAARPSSAAPAVAAGPSASAPRRSGLTKRAAAAVTAVAGAATLLISKTAWAMPDGMGSWEYRQVANSGATHPAVHAAASSGDTSGWVIVGVLAAVAGVIGLTVWLMRRHSEKRWERIEHEAGITSEPDRFEGGTLLPGGLGSGSTAKAKGKDEEPKGPTFEDVAGQDEAKTELAEIVDYLKNPEAYKKLHPRYKGPKGVLMFGPPGTGKTLLARAVANEAGVPFVHKAGSDFINTYVGTGANNIRSAFEEVRKQIKEKGGAGILFIDEIEAIGGARTGNSDRSEETRTINALLKEMDGFEKDNIIVIAATNMPDSLDPALVRGGRFGTKVPVGKPDVVGREAILNVHLKGAALDPDVDAKAVAKQTPGLAGADLEQIIMDSVKLAKRRGAKAIAQQDLIKAVDEFTTGKQRNLVMSKKDKEIVAFHESGHALVSHLLPDADPVRKVTIIPHGLNALGFMQAMPEEEKVLYSREWLVDRIAVALGGRVAEKMMTGRVYSGAQNDLQQATRLAKLMVMQFGMNDEIGHVSYDMEGERPAVGGPMSEETRKKIDAEVKSIIHDALARVETLLGEHRPALEAMAAELMEKETLRSEDMERIIEASKPAPPAPPTAKP